jgi:hypothetical protein
MEHIEMKTSTVLGGTAGALAAVVGLAAAIFMPVIGLVAGAIAVHGAVAATMGTAATLALTAAGAVGGLVVGRLAAPIVAFAALGVGAAVGGVVKLASAAVEGFASLFTRKNKQAAAPEAEKTPAPRALADNGKSGFAQKFAGLSLTSTFDDAQQSSNDNKKAPAAKPALEKKGTGFRL